MFSSIICIRDVIRPGIAFIYLNHAEYIGRKQVC
jgi:hypothetical protein